VTPPLAERVSRLTLPIRTRRLELVPPGLDHVGALVALLRDPSVARWTLYIPHPYSAIQARKDVLRAQDWRRKGRGVSRFVVRRVDSTLVGGVVLYPLDERNASAEVGVWLGRPFRHQGYAEEAVQALVKVAFERLGLHRVQATVFAENASAIRLLRRCGFRYEGRVRDEARKNGVWQSTRRFALLATDRVKSPRTSRPA
jgi:[ribosomal protein S5]-alanine N-acetyltransferase